MPDHDLPSARRPDDEDDGWRADESDQANHHAAAMTNRTPPEEAPLAPAEKPMGFFDHVDELRGTLMKCALVFVVMAVAVGFFLKQFNSLLLWPLAVIGGEQPALALELGTTSVMEGFSVVLVMCGFGGLVLAAPFMLFFVGQFVSPALTLSERRLALPTVFGASGLFLLGAAFGFFLLVPSTIRVAIEVNEFLGYTLRWTPGSYYNLLAWLVLGVGVAFEFPLLIVICVHLGFLSVATLRKYRRHSIVGIFLLAAIITPTPDPLTQSMFAAPLYVLFEIAILVGARVERKRVARLAAEATI
jgi:sec-independent protein translocase protein TatC